MEKMVYVRTDKNGTKIYHDYTCPRCGGAGGCSMWAYTGWTCYECGGSGKRVTPRIVKEYTPEYEAKLDAQRAKRAEKKRIETERKQQEEAAGNTAEWLATHGFTADGITYVILGDTYAAKEQLKADGAKFDICIGWHADHEVSGFCSIAVHVDEIAERNAWGRYDITANRAEWDSKKAAALKQLSGAKESNHYGNVGDKVQMELELVRVSFFDTFYGSTTVYTMKDNDGNLFVWKTTSCLDRIVDGECKPILKGEHFTLKGTVKEHSEYKGEKQTVLTRCKVA